MLKLDQLNMSFGQKTVFANASYIAYRGELNILKGRSGSGKSTLVQALMFHYPCQYEYDGMDVGNLTEEEQAKFIFKHLHCINQQPLFMDDLTLRENAAFVCGLYNKTDMKEDIAGKLCITDLMDAYPSALSGGEKTRAALYIALIREPDILVADEPTASLGEEHKGIVISLLKEYAKEHIVICPTHDDALLSEGILCEISNASIRNVEFDEPEKSNTDSSLVNGYESFGNLFKQEEKHHRTRKALKALVPCLATILLFASLSLNNVVIRNAKANMNEAVQRVLLVYKPVYSGEPYRYGGEMPISESEYDAICQIKHISAIYPRLDYNIFFLTPVYEDGTEIDRIEFPASYALYDGDTLVAQTTSEGQVQTYNEGRDYGKDITKVFGDHGVYISDQLYHDLINQSQEPADPYIGFQLYVPVYSEIGTAYTYDSDGNHVDMNSYECIRINARLPLRGIVRNSRLGMGDGRACIFVEYDEMMAYASQLDYPKDRVTYTVYTADGEWKGYWVDKEPSPLAETDIVEPLVETAYRPSAYEIEVDDIENMAYVLDAVAKTGLKAENEYYSSLNVLNVSQRTKRNMTIVSTIVFVLAMAARFLMHLAQRKDYTRVLSWLESLGFDKKQRGGYLAQKTWRNTWRMALFCTVAYYIAIIVLARMSITIIQPLPQTFIGMFLTLLFSEFLFPRLLLKP